MAFADALADFVEGILAWASKGVKQGVADYIDIEAPDDERTFAMKDGTLLTILQLHGSYRMTGPEEFEDTTSRIARSLKAYLDSGGHAVQVFFSADPDAADRDIRTALEPSMATAKRLNLDLDDLFEEDIGHLAKYCSNEKVFVVLITRPAAITAADQKMDRKAKQELLTANPLPRLSDAPNLFAAMTALRTRHSSFVSAIMGDFQDVRLSAEVLDIHRSAYEQRMSIDPEFTADDWRARLPGDRIPVVRNGRAANDMTDNYWPRIDRQLAPRDGVVRDLKTVEMGDKLYAPMYIHLHPEEIQPFQQLFRRVASNRMPWRMSFLIESDGLKVVGFKSLIAAFFGWSNNENKLIKAAIDEIKRLKQTHNELDVRFRVDFATWAPKGESKLLATRASRLARAVQGWGRADVREVSGDAYQGFVSSALGMSLKSVATPSCALLDDVAQMLPLHRPATPWTEGGAVMYRTPDGKLWAYQPNSPVQSNCINLHVAEPRSGKSVNSNMINLALCLSPGITRLPMIAIVDVGRASAGLISLLQNALPQNQRHLAALIRMRMVKEKSVNPCDTQLGCRFLLPHEEAFLVNFVTLLVTPLGSTAPADGMAGLVKMVIQEAYKVYSSDGESVKKYSPGMEDGQLVDEAIRRYGVHLDEHTTWWEIVDELFKHGATHEAMLAQRFAVPLISDLAAVSRMPQLKDMYGEKGISGDTESLLQAFSRMLSESIRSYPILGSPTKFDIGDARVVAMDLDEVAKSGSVSADHQTAVCYMLARYVTARNFYLAEEHVEMFPAQYRAFHDARIREIRQDKKHLCMDEFHRTQRVQAVRDQVLVDMREGGKWGVMTTLISQDVGDFDDKMLSFATGKFIISRQNELNADKMRKLFGLSETETYAVRHHIRPPGPHGSTFVALFSTKRGETAHVLNATLGGIKLWAFSTTSEDGYIRDSLYAKIGPTKTRRLLARLYPGGSLVDEIDRRKRSMENSGIIGDDRLSEGVINDLIQEILHIHDREERKAA